MPLNFGTYLVQGRPSPLSIEYFGTSTISGLSLARRVDANGRERDERASAVAVFVVLTVDLSSTPLSWRRSRGFSTCSECVSWFFESLTALSDTSDIATLSFLARRGVVNSRRMCSLQQRQ